MAAAPLQCKATATRNCPHFTTLLHSARSTCLTEFEEDMRIRLLIGEFGGEERKKKRKLALAACGLMPSSASS